MDGSKGEEMSLDEIMTWMLVIAAAMFLASFAMLLYTAGLLLHVRAEVKQFRPPEVARNADGRRLKERV